MSQIEISEYGQLSLKPRFVQRGILDSTKTVTLNPLAHCPLCLIYMQLVLVPDERHARCSTW